MATIIDKEDLKEALKALAIEDPTYFSLLLNEIKTEIGDTIHPLLNEVITRNFKKYEQVFRALA